MMLISKMTFRDSRWSALVQNRLLQIITHCRMAARMIRRRTLAARKYLNQPCSAPPHQTFPCHFTLLALATLQGGHCLRVIRQSFCLLFL